MALIAFKMSGWEMLNFIFGNFPESKENFNTFIAPMYLICTLKP